MADALRIGCVKYLNARPLIHGWPGDVVFDHPAALCRKLSRGELDVALVSSIEYVRDPIYKIVDDISIASAGAVYSVILAHRGELSAIKEIQLDPASQTSIALLRLLLDKRGLAPRLVDAAGPAGEAAAPYPPSRALLLIGDQAIRFRQSRSDYQYWDLGEAWQEDVNLPFVYALWLVRPEVFEPHSTARRLRNLRDENVAHIDRVIVEEKEFDASFCRGYYRDYLRFNFGQQEKAGLQKFAEACQALRLLSAPPRQFDLI